MTLGALIPVLALVTLGLGAAFGAYRLMRVRAKQDESEKLG